MTSKTAITNLGDFILFFRYSRCITGNVFFERALHKGKNHVLRHGLFTDISVHLICQSLTINDKIRRTIRSESTNLLLLIKRKLPDYSRTGERLLFLNCKRR